MADLAGLMEAIDERDRGGRSQEASQAMALDEGCTTSGLLAVRASVMLAVRVHGERPELMDRLAVIDNILADRPDEMEDEELWTKVARQRTPGRVKRWPIIQRRLFSR